MSKFDEVLRLLESENMGEVADALIVEEIDNETLPFITEEMLEKLGIRPLGRRLNALKLIKNASVIQPELPKNVSGQNESTTSQHAVNAKDVQNIVESSYDGKKASDTAAKLPCPLPYPPFSPRICDAERNNNILLVRAQLIRETARFFLSLKYDLVKHYDEICQHLLKRFPDLQDAIILPGATCTYIKLKHDLAQSVRNHKRTSTSTSVLKKTGEALITEQGPPMSSAENALVTKMLEELHRAANKSKPSQDHIKKLLLGLKSNYSEWINSEVRSLKDVIEKYPVLQYAKWVSIQDGFSKIIYQACLLIGTTEEEIDERMSSLFESIRKIMGSKEESDLKLVIFVEQAINAKKNESVFRINMPGAKQFQPTAATPTLMVTISEDGEEINQGFLFVDKVLMCELEYPNVIVLLKLWISAHYVFNIEYGKDTVNFAYLLEDCVLMEHGLNSIQHYRNASQAKRRSISRSNKLEIFYGRLKAAGLEI
ncbi:uncharacterized protein LOC114535239 [Dendronephthya gigantea]|uniref:uncharacterized protein LOC114535239 n=1 Tax=Dendronephthya gigantea TaxID=151771 RepID=UPI0010698954|nr:uncharacterized protein LOC114535239 [Dendronephthya gigantea]